MAEERRPLGVMPHKIWLCHRTQDLADAISRYAAEANTVEQWEMASEWTAELQRHVDEIREIYRRKQFIKDAVKP